MIPKTYNDVRTEFLSFKEQHPDDPTPLSAFAKTWDEVQGTPGQRATAYKDNWVKQANAAVDRGFETTRVPQAAGAVASWLGGKVDDLTGTHIAPIVEQVGRDTPRMLAESLATIPMAASGAGTVGAGAMWANRIRKLMQIAGYGGAAAQSYSQTDSPLGAVIAPAQMFGMNKLLLPAANAGLGVPAKVGGLVEKWLGAAPTVTQETATDLAARIPTATLLSNTQRFVPKAAAVATEGAIMAGGNEATRQAMMSVGPNAVPLTDSSRNPITQENIAGNVAGMLPFVGQAVLGLRNVPRFSAQEHAGLYKWHETRKMVDETYLGTTGEQRQIYDSLTTPEDRQAWIEATKQTQLSGGSLEDVAKATTPETPFTSTIPVAELAGQQKLAALQAIIDGTRQADLDGAVEVAQRGRAQISQLLGETPSATLNVETTASAAQILKDGVRASPPESVKGLSDFVHDLNNTIASWNEIRKQYDEISNKPFEDRTTQDEAVLKKLESQIGDTWRPEARDPAVLQRLRKNNLIPEVTEKWLKDEFDYTFDHSGDAQFSYEATLQKAANLVADAIPEGLRRAANLPVETTSTQVDPNSAIGRQVKLDEVEDTFIKSLISLPKEIQNAAIQRTVELKNKSIVPESGQMVGRLSGPYSSWRLAVIKAFNTFDPTTRTIELYKGKKEGQPVYERTSVDRLVKKNSQGEYEFIPSWSAISTAEGGTGVSRIKEKTLPEIGLEGMVKKVEEPLVPSDLEDLKMILAEQGAGEVLTGPEFGEGGKVVSTAEQIPAESGVVAPTKEQVDVYEKAKQLKTVLPKLSDEQLYEATKHAFWTGRTDALAEYRKTGGIRAALEAALETMGADKGTKESLVGPATQRFLDLEKARRGGEFSKSMQGWTPRRQALILLDDFFMKKTSVEGGKKGLTNVEARIGQIVDRVLNPKVVDIATKRASGGVVGEKNVFVNIPATTQSFVQDATSTFKAQLNQAFDAVGFDGTWKDLWIEKAHLIASQMKDVPSEFYRLASEGQGLAQVQSKDGKGVGAVGVNVDRQIRLNQPSATRFMNQLMTTLAHEISHVDDFVRLGMIEAPDAYSRERLRHLTNLTRVADVMTPEQRGAHIKMLHDGLEPSLYNSMNVEPTNTKLPYGSLLPEEYTAEITAMVTRALVQGEGSYLRSAMNVFDFAPIEVRSFAMSTWRTIGDVLDALKETIRDPNSDRVTNLGPVDRKTTADLLEGAVFASRAASKLRFADKQYSQQQAFVGTMSPGAAAFPPVMTPAMWFSQSAVLQKSGNLGEHTPEPRFMPAAVQAIQDAGTLLKGDPGWRANIDQQNKLGIWSSWIKPFVHQMWEMDRMGIPLAREFVSSALELSPASHRIRTMILAPFMVQDKTGAWGYDKTHPMIEKISQDRNGPWRGVVNKVSAWQQVSREVVDPVTGTKTKQETTMFLKDKDGTITVRPEAQKDWDVMRKSLSPEDQQYVMSSSVALDEVTQNAGQRLVGSLQNTVVIRTAELLMSMNPKMTVDEAKTVAPQIALAFTPVEGKPFDPTKALRGVVPEEQIVAFQRYLIGDKEANGSFTGMIPQFLKVKENFESKPGHRTESLPWDWIVRYKNKDGEVKYLSAKSEQRAIHLARQLRDQGNTLAGEVINKRDLNEFTDFDNPDVVLQKAAQVEQKVWNRFITEMEQKNGTQFADQLRAGYTPVAEAQKEVTNRGMGRFLNERKAQVDREMYDYIDGTIAWVGSLSSSLARKEITQQKDLILKDPRVRSLPTFTNLVNEHFSEMMTPTSQWAKQLKMLSSGYFLAGSFGSALVEMTQSVVSTIPILIAGNDKGGVVKAYQQLGSAIGETVQVSLARDWQTLAKAALTKDPKTLTKKEAIYATYFKHVEDGGVTHGVVEDLIFGRDQKAIEAAKFGNGDYGQTSVNDMIMNPVYMGTQFLMMFYKWAAKFNNKVSFLSSVDQGFDKGLRGQELYDYARMNKTLMTYEGGKANQIGAMTKLSNDYTRSPLGVANTLQQYGYGMVATFHQLAKDSLGKSPGLTPIQRRQAQKALTTWTATNLALSGALGMPFAAAALTLLDKAGVPATQSVREGLAGLSDDQETGAAITETALNGFANQMFGLDVSSRLGVSNILGTSSYRGFNVADMFGPAPSIVANMVQALGLYGQNEPMKATRALLPNAFKTMFETKMNEIEYGDNAFRDASGNLLYKPTQSQAAMYMIGFRPRELSQKRQFQQLKTLSEQRAKTQTDHELDDVAVSVLQGDSEKAQRYAYDKYYSDPTVNPREVMRSIQERAIDMQSEKDLLASGSRAGRESLKRLAGTFSPEINTRQSELARADLRDRLAVQMGDPRLMTTKEQYKQAMLVDMLVQESGMPRGEALQLAGFLQHGPTQP
jgi:hypothetical protein